MNSSALTGSNRLTLEALFRHPAPHDLAWHDVRALLSELGSVIEQPNGHVKVTRRGHSLVLHSPGAGQVAEMSTLAELRHFLERSEKPAVPTTGVDRHWLVVINHHEALVYRSIIQNSLPLQVLPHAPETHFRHARHSRDFSRGQERPDPSSFFAPVVTALNGEGKILLFGSGKGMGSEMEQFLAWAKQHHAGLAARIIGSLVIDANHTTPAQLLAKAREFYATVAPSLLR